VNRSAAAPAGMVDLGAGADRLTLDGVGPGAPRKFFGGDGNDVLTLTNGAGATITFDGGAGTADEIVLLGSDADDDIVNLSVNTIDALGYTATYTTPATERMTVNTMGGVDRITLGATLRAKTTVIGGAGDDVFHLDPPETDFYGNRLGSIVTLFGGDGTDAIDYSGGALNDTLALHATKIVHGSIYDVAYIAELEHVTLRGGIGNDQIVSDASTVGMTLYADGGDGSDSVRFAGGTGSDAIAITPASITAAERAVGMAAIEAVSVNGALGNDEVTISGSAPGTAVTVSGDGGDDVLNVNGAPWAGIVFNGGTTAGTKHTLNVNAGTFTFATDARLTTLDLTVNVAAADAAVVFSASQRLAALNIAGGTARLSAAGNRVLRTRALTVTIGGSLDLADNDAIIDYDAADESPTAAIEALVSRGYDGGTWTGDGIRSSTAAAAEGPAIGLTGIGLAEPAAIYGISGTETITWSGQTIDATCLLLKYTYIGDANLDGLVDGADYGQIDNWVQFPGSHGYWNGDFNYDGVIDGADYGLIDNSVQLQGPRL
jgi:hypothetical protein